MADEIVKKAILEGINSTKKVAAFAPPPFLFRLVKNYLCVLDLATIFLLNFSLFVVNLTY